MAALAGSAALAGRGKGTAFPRPKAGTIDQMAANAAGTDSAVTGTEYPGANVKAPISKNIFRTRHRLTDSAGNTIPKNHMANIAAMNAPKGIYPPGSVTMPRTGMGHPLAKGRRFSKGGRVTGIAKRGFGRALMKGKK